MLIENSVTRVTVRYHEARRVMPSSCSSDGIFNLHRKPIMDSFSCILFLRRLHLDLNMSCFINFTLKYLHFFIKKSSVRFHSYTLTSKRLAETDVKMTSKRHNSHTGVVLHPSSKTTFSSAGRVHGNPGRVCKKNCLCSFPVWCLGQDMEFDCIGF